MENTEWAYTGAPPCCSSPDCFSQTIPEHYLNHWASDGSPYVDLGEHFCEEMLQWWSLNYPAYAHDPLGDNAGQPYVLGFPGPQGSTTPSGFDDAQMIFTPTDIPTDKLTYVPTYIPADIPTDKPTYAPNYTPTDTPSYTPSYTPNYIPTYPPNYTPIDILTYVPNCTLTDAPTDTPYPPNVGQESDGLPAFRFVNQTPQTLEGSSFEPLTRKGHTKPVIPPREPPVIPDLSGKVAIPRCDAKSRILRRPKKRRSRPGFVDGWFQEVFAPK